MQDSQGFMAQGKKQGVDVKILEAAVALSLQITNRNPNITPLLTLKHFCVLANVDYKYMRRIIGRYNPESYHVFRLRKNTPHRGYRTIVVPQPELMQAQRWILDNILNHEKAHDASFAYEKGKTIKQAAALHCKCQWMVKLDMRRFFESFSEIAVYRVFHKMGYQPLIAFELARICTRLSYKKTGFNIKKHWRCFPPSYKPSRKYKVVRLEKAVKDCPKDEKKYSYLNEKWELCDTPNYEYYDRWDDDRNYIEYYERYRMGHLPQGAPTSPMLANLIMCDFDQKVMKIAKDRGLVYSRYSDDITVSTQDKSMSRDDVRLVITQIYRIMTQYGLSPNTTKTKIISPGARKQVLGLLVDGESPKLSKQFRDNLRLHLYYLTKPEIGPKIHAQKRGFASVIGLKNHIWGLVSYAIQIDPKYSKRYRERFNLINW